MPHAREVAKLMQINRGNHHFRSRSLFRYLYRWLFLMFSVLIAASMGFNLYSYAREKRNYYEIIQQEQKSRIDTLSRYLNDELIKLRFSANVELQRQEVSDLYVKYQFDNSYERGKLIEQIRLRCMMLENMNPLVRSCTIYFPEIHLKINKNGYYNMNSDTEELFNSDVDQDVVTFY